MNSFKNRYIIAILLLTTVFYACKKQWDDRTEAVDQQLDKTVMQQIQENGNLSTFAGYLTRLGYDKLLASSRTYTVWAPTNQALQGVDQATVSDTAKLRVFVNNHIANQVYLTTAPKPSLRVRTLGGKNLTFTTGMVEEANITVANQYVKNGVVHTIDKALPPKMNISEFIRSLNGVADLHKNYITRQDTNFIDTSKATIQSYDPKTGKPVLVPGTGVVNLNKYFTRVASLANEDSTYTYFVLTDAALNTELDKVVKYFATVTNSTDTTRNMLASFNILKDVAVRGAIAEANLPATGLMSVNNVPIPVNKAAIVQRYSASNGMVYVIGSMPFALADKITPIVIQGENPSFFARTDANSFTFYRSRRDLQGQVFRDILLGTNANFPANFFAAYKLNNLYTCQYKIVVRASNDVFTTATDIVESFNFGQTTAAVLGANGTITPNAVVNFPAQRMGPVSLTKYEEIPLPTPANRSATSTLTPPTNIAGGNPTTTATAANTITLTSGNLNVLKRTSVNMYVVGANATGANNNNITFDYVKLIPILQ
ncbi:fasciclin domain-containing protein [Mucilaginibacter sp. PAMB04274]|uniref:fasciclin domain-containing protein n=1 Tax=Mucilaginibacter sp. PAMB04274 TaxID=3138568 RepID=UPI0031F6F422